MGFFATLAQRLAGSSSTRRRGSSIALDTHVAVEDLPLYAQVRRVGGSLTPEQVAAALAQADMGTMWPLVALANDARQKETHLQTVLFTRETALAMLPWEVVPASERRKDRKVAEWLHDTLVNVAGGPAEGSTLASLPGLISHLQSAPYHGYALSEPVYDKVDGLFIPRGWNNVGAHRVLFDQQTGRPHWYDPIGTTAYPGLDLRRDFAPGKVIFHQPRINGDEPHREGLSRLLLWCSLYRTWSQRDWIALGELSWKPWRLGSYTKQADDEDIKALVAILRNMTASSVGVVPETTKVQVEWPKGIGPGSTHRELSEFLAAEMSKAVLGQTLTTEAGDRGARSLGEVHQDVKAQIKAYDAWCVAETFRRDQVVPLIRRNFGYDVGIPGFRFLIEEAVDMKSFGEGLTAVKTAGLKKIPAAWVRDRTGIPEPQDGEELLDNEVDIPIDPATGLPEEPDADAGDEKPQGDDASSDGKGDKKPDDASAEEPTASKNKGDGKASKASKKRVAGAGERQRVRVRVTDFLDDDELTDLAERTALVHRPGPQRLRTLTPARGARLA